MNRIAMTTPVPCEELTYDKHDEIHALAAEILHEMDVYDGHVLTEETMPHFIQAHVQKRLSDANVNSNATGAKPPTTVDVPSLIDDKLDNRPSPYRSDLLHFQTVRSEKEAQFAKYKTAPLSLNSDDEASDESSSEEASSENGWSSDDEEDTPQSFVEFKDATCQTVELAIETPPRVPLLRDAEVQVTSHDVIPEQFKSEDMSIQPLIHLPHDVRLETKRKVHHMSIQTINCDTKHCGVMTTSASMDEKAAQTNTTNSLASLLKQNTPGGELSSDFELDLSNLDQRLRGMIP
ncbi:hypothetical protein Ae201684P_019386 [Aphanomyces euteiches]|uniref:Uncharacterized protein n=1 Tax=Aphanomyces euteiches TaxID=100861 RepID=A0A6G0W6C6_9STRA|nr:hypothetical protein Ae201684_018997 [Aphanomyces euteiches]KAH9078295.1 hypothetical protein Ae201684P_019386 [Aphanomyces euteiches]KAH9141156.1 hypothetical protein AeRB84_014651 [Aphanomyces euteiches]